jgi:hypothetical protein
MHFTCFPAPTDWLRGVPLNSRFTPRYTLPLPASAAALRVCSHQAQKGCGAATQHLHTHQPVLGWCYTSRNAQQQQVWLEADDVEQG